MKITYLNGTKRDFLTLQSADLRGADLQGANLRGANLRGADLRGVNLLGADLRGADLQSADLRGANLRGANLRGADLRDANLRDANLRGADLRDAKGLQAFVIVPAGTITGFKKLANGVIAILTIPADAERVNAYGSRKCRAEYAIVKSGNGVSARDGGLLYISGKRVIPDSFDPDPRVVCSNGIHFFITREEAEEY